MNTVGLKLHSGTAIAADITPKLGQPIPTAWYHRLHSDIHNVFRSHEWVGYENKENHIIFARVEYRVEKFHDTREEYENASEDEEEWIGDELDSYVIMISSDINEEPVTVSVVELYKILRVKQVHGSKEMVLYDPEGSSVQFWDIIKDEKLRSILKRISKELKQILRLTEEQRRKAIKAMCLKWHPDKSPHPFAKEAFQYLQHEVKRLDTYPFWGKEFQRADDLVHISVDAHTSEQEEFNKGHSSSITKIIKLECQVKPDGSKAKIWLEQAEYDMEALRVLFCPDLPQLSAHVCFMANQVAEKGLRAGMYVLIGLQLFDLKHHDLKGFAKKIEANSNADGLKQAAAVLNHGMYLNTRYPNQYGPSHAVPSNEYEVPNAAQAKKNAEKLLKAIRPLVQQNH